MKHVFYVHSFVTYLVTLGVVEHENISEEDVVILTARGSINQTRFTNIDVNLKFPSLFGVPCFGHRLFYITNYLTIYKFDSLLTEVCNGKSFICYLPTDKHYMQQLIMTHTLCKKINYIEEGLFSYNDEYRKKEWPFNGLMGIVKRFLNTGNRNISPYSKTGSRTLYTLFDPANYEGDIEKKCVMPTISQISYDGIVLHDTNILMMNAFRDASQVVTSGVLTIIADFAKSLSVSNQSIYIKHHPYSSEELRVQIEKTFAQFGVTYHILDNKLNTELMLFNSSNLSIYGFFSAAMLYGAMAGHKSITFVNDFRSINDECAAYLSINFHIPKIFFHNSTNYGH